LIKNSGLTIQPKAIGGTPKILAQQDGAINKRVEDHPFLEVFVILKRC